MSQGGGPENFIAATMPGVMRKPRRQSAFLHLALTLFGVGAGLGRFLPSLFRSRSALVAENLFLRKQLAS